MCSDEFHQPMIAYDCRYLYRNSVYSSYNNESLWNEFLILVLALRSTNKLFLLPSLTTSHTTPHDPLRPTLARLGMLACTSKAVMLAILAASSLALYLL